MRMDKQYILAIDHGTTSTRAILFDHECNMVDIVQKEGKVEYPKSGWVEQDALAVWLTTFKNTNPCCCKPERHILPACSINISSQAEKT